MVSLLSFSTKLDAHNGRTFADLGECMSYLRRQGRTPELRKGQLFESGVCIGAVVSPDFLNDLDQAANDHANHTVDVWAKAHMTYPKSNKG